jgi:hypothetical protein
MVKMSSNKREQTRIVEDGEEVHVDVLLADSIRHRDRRLWDTADLSLHLHQPGFRTADAAGYTDKSSRTGATPFVSNDAARDAARSARDRWIADMSSAWRDGGRKRRREPPDDDDNGDDDENGDENNDRRSRSAGDARAAARRSYDAMVARLGRAWRTPVYQRLVNRDAAEPDLSSPPEIMRRHLRGDEPPDREKMYRQRNADLENAWRSPTPGTMIRRSLRTSVRGQLV